MKSGAAPASAGRKSGLGVGQVYRTTSSLMTSKSGRTPPARITVGGPDGESSGFPATSSHQLAKVL